MASGQPSARRAMTSAVTVALVVSSIVIEWLFLTGAPLTRTALATAFIPQAPGAGTRAVLTRPAFQTGVVFPRWGASAYSPVDPNYGVGLNEIQSQTGASWIELAFTLHQATYTSTQVAPEANAPTPEALAQGIEAAHAHGFKVFVVPLLGLDAPEPGGTHWSGAIRFPDPARDTPLWFTSYWQAIEPYMEAGQRAHADQLAIGTELQSLEGAPDQFWYWLIQQARTVYAGRLTYDMNFTSLPFAAPDWMRSPDLAALGVSMYTTIGGVHADSSLADVAERWARTAGKLLDTFAARVDKPVFISEIGYRNASDALLYPYVQVSSAPPDPQLQAAAYSAALLYVMSDPHCAGIYFWAWSLPPFSPNWLPAARMMKTWYQSPLA